MKQIEITFNDDVEQATIDSIASTLGQLLEACFITAVILVQDVPVDDEIPSGVELNYDNSDIDPKVTLL